MSETAARESCVFSLFGSFIQFDLTLHFFGSIFRTNNFLFVLEKTANEHMSTVRNFIKYPLKLSGI
jgi:hypothetical protein